ncbi:hypothetical protein GJ496_005834 [Pomphorhynchus laevis]|nr:hypothetical protein GJ496_005834 [Pomphorhynchus laevis]
MNHAFSWLYCSDSKSILDYVRIWIIWSAGPFDTNSSANIPKTFRKLGSLWPNGGDTNAGKIFATRWPIEQTDAQKIGRAVS